MMRALLLSLAACALIVSAGHASIGPTGDPWKHPKPAIVAPVVPAGVPSRELCAPVPILRADGTIGVYADWTLSDYQNPASVAHTWPLAIYVPGKGLTCDQAGPATGRLFEDLYEEHTP